MSKRRTRTGRPPLIHASPDGYSTNAFTAAVRTKPVAESVATIDPATPAARVDVREANVGGTTVTAPGRVLVRLIRAGWSLNSNYWPAEVLRRDGPAAWPKGTLCYIDHAPEGEQEAYPSGSIRNLAATLTTDARWDDAEQALFAEARLFHPWRDTITDMADAIGMSIRAWVTCNTGEAEGRQGEIIESIPQGRSVDFVTVPAAGGGIVSVLEAVNRQIPVAEARNCGHWFEARIHGHFSQLADEMFGEGFLTRDERITLSSAVGDALAAFAGRIEADAPHLYDRDPYIEPETPEVAPAEEAAAERQPETAPKPEVGSSDPATEDVTDGIPPAAPNPPTDEEPAMSGTETGAPPVQAGTATAADTAPTNPAQEAAPQTPQAAPVDVSAVVQQAVTAALAPIQQALAAQTERANQQDAENQRLRNTSRASEAVATALRAPALADVAAQIGPRVTARVLAAVPTSTDGAMDETALSEAITSAVNDEAAFVRGLRAEALESAGVGQPYGLGASKTEAVDDGFEAEMENFFSGVLGMTTEQAGIAAKGRV